MFLYCLQQRKQRFLLTKKHYLFFLEIMDKYFPCWRHFLLLEKSETHYFHTKRLKILYFVRGKKIVLSSSATQLFGRGLIRQKFAVFSSQLLLCQDAFLCWGKWWWVCKICFTVNVQFSVDLKKPQSDQIQKFLYKRHQYVGILSMREILWLFTQMTMVKFIKK